MRAAPALLATALATSAAGADASGSATEVLPAVPAAASDLPAPTPRADELLPPGRYRLEMRLAARVELPWLGDLEGATASLSEARVAHDDGVRQRHRVCALWDATAAPWGGLVFPAAFVAALDGPRYAVGLAPSADGRVRYRADLGVERIGFAADAAAAAPATGIAHPDAVAADLPAGAADPRVRDWDGDGRPGATLRLRLPLVPDAELWIVQRGRAVLDGVVVAPGRVEGRMRVVEFAQEVIGARPGFLHRTPRQTPDPDASHFTLVRVGEGSGCDDLRRDGPDDRPGLGAESAS